MQILPIGKLLMMVLWAEGLKEILKLTTQVWVFFYGKVSTENIGGFSSVRHEFAPLAVTKDSTIRIRLKGDGKDYQFRIKDNVSTSHSYIGTFLTNGEWQNIEIILANLEPSFRGRKLAMPNLIRLLFKKFVF